MPAGDGTGANGIGPMTGRGAGYCSGNSRSAFDVRRFGIRCGRFFHRNIFGGRGFRRRNWLIERGCFQPNDADLGIWEFLKEDEMKFLNKQVMDLEEELKNLNSRIEELYKEE
jgi:hypothetical protein